MSSSRGLSGYNNYKLGLEKALKDEPNSENLLEMERKYNNDEFKDVWSLYDDWKKKIRKSMYVVFIWA